jgi:hypothetical protein
MRFVLETSLHQKSYMPAFRKVKNISSQLRLRSDNGRDLNKYKTASHTFAVIVRNAYSLK